MIWNLYLFWQCKKPPVSSDIKPPLKGKGSQICQMCQWIAIKKDRRVGGYGSKIVKISQRLKWMTPKQCKGPFLQCIFMSNAALRIRLWLLLQTLLFFANYSQLLVPMRVWENMSISMAGVIYNVKNGSSFIVSKISSKNLSNESKCALVLLLFSRPNVN